MAKTSRQEEKASAPAKASSRKTVQVTLGDLIAATYDAVGTMKDVARVLSSRHLEAAIHRRIVLV
jgi:hypothetical protein